MNKQILLKFNKVIQQVKIEPSVLFLTTEHERNFYQLPWSCVYSTIRDPDAYIAFVNPKRRICGIVSETDSKFVRLNQRELPYVQVLGRASDDTDILNQRVATRKLMEIIPKLLETTGRILVDCSALTSKIQDELWVQLYQIKRKRSVYLFGTSKIVQDEFVQRMIEDGIVISFDETLFELLKAQAIEAENEGDWNNQDNEIIESKVTIYLRNKPYNMDSPGEQENLINVASFATLLSYEELEKTNTNINEYNREIWFQQFLLASGTGQPKWYGYRRDNLFHLKRYFEENLYIKTLALLKDAESKTRNHKPIMLRGQTCVGKTNALGALAYRIFHDYYYPVVYIRESNVNFSNISITNNEGIIEVQRSAAFNALEGLLRQIEAKSNDPVPTLIIWDTSCHLSSEIKEAHELLINLRSLGRQVQVVCTSHGIVNGIQNEKKGKNPYNYYDIMDIDPKLVGPSNIREDYPSCDETAQVESMLIKFGGFRLWDAKKLISYYSDMETFIGTLYLFRNLHQTLSRKVRDENAGQIKGTMQEIENLILKETKAKREELLNGAIAQQLRKELERVNRKLLPDEEGDVKESEEKTRERALKIEKLVRCIALCTIYKEKFPVSMAIRLIGTIDATSAKVFGLIMNSAMLEGGMSTNDEPIVFFRNELEARLLLDNYDGHKVSNAERITLVEDLINAMPIQDDSEEVRLVQRLIRIIGPNSNSNNVEWSLWEDNFDSFEKLISTLRSFREEKRSDLLLLPELTLTRELCQHNNYPYDDKQKILQLQQALKLTDDKVQSIESDMLTTTMANLYVEWANIYLLLSRIEVANIAKENMYKEVYPKMERVIRQFPRKGYAYSAYLWSGVTYVKTLSEINNDKLKLLQHLCNIVDIVRDEITEGGMDENALANVDALADSVTMSDERFQQSVHEGSSYGLYFRIRKLISGENGQKTLDFTTPLGENIENKKRLKNIVDYIENREYKPLLEKDAACMYAIINAKWLLYSKYPIFPSQENCCIGLSRENWNDIHNSCCYYLDKLSRFRSPRIIYLQALAALHIPEHRLEVEGLLSELKKGSNMEPRSYHILCNEDGTPVLFRGQVISFNKHKDSGFIKIEAAGFRQDIHFRPTRIGRPKSNISQKERFQDLSVAIGPRGLQICKL